MIKLFEPYIDQNGIDAVAKVLKSGWIGTGPVVAELEEEFASYVGANYAVAVNSATSALHLAIIVTGVKEGDEVITTPNTFISTTHAILYENAIPVFCDVEDGTGNLDLDKAEELVTSRTRAIMVVHYAGNPLNMDKLYEFARRHNIEVIEDAAHAMGALYQQQPIGSFGLTCFSFQAVKNLPAGDGGMITTNDREQYDRLMKLRWMGIDKSTFDRTSDTEYAWEYEVDEIGYKYAMNDINAALVLSGLNHLEADNAARQSIADAYRAGLHGEIRTLDYTFGAKSSNHIFAIRVSNRDELYEKLAKAGINAGVHYKPNHLYPIYERIPYILPVAEQIYRETLSLPMHMKLTPADVTYICEKVNEGAR